CRCIARFLSSLFLSRPPLRSTLFPYTTLFRSLLNVPIDYYAVVNMGVLKKVVNTVGGVNVDNPFAFDYEGHHFPKGQQHLNGDNALKYSRMRYDDPNNDYGRQKRQQQIIISVIDQFKHHASAKSADSIIQAVGDGVKTNVPIN